VILDDLAAAARRRVEEAKRRVPLEAVREAALARGSAPEGAFARALSAPGLSFICEVKRASPSKGVIAAGWTDADFPYLDIAREYEAAGAAAISVLTEPTRFLGRDEYLAGIARSAGIPVLRKDFIVDPYQLYEAKVLGASAALLIAALLPEETLIQFIALTERLGMDALVEVHNEAEAAAALAAGARIIGVNNRDLRTFTVDLSTTPRLRHLIPPGHIVVAESGVSTPADIAALGPGIDAVLVGESFMRAPDKKRHLQELRAAYTRV
jgi:indole-3-glycerol phosphate synthase